VAAPPAGTAAAIMAEAVVVFQVAAVPGAAASVAVADLSGEAVPPGAGNQWRL